MAHRERFVVTFADVDMMGHVNNATYFTYFETARTNYYLQLARLPYPWSPKQLDIIVAKANCEFKRPLRWGEKIEVVVWPSHVGDTSFAFSYLLLDEQGRVAAQGETIQVLFDYEQGSKKRISDSLRRILLSEKQAGPGIALPPDGRNE